MAVELVKMYNIPFGIVINKDDEKDNIIKKYCKEEEINLIGTIPYAKKLQLFILKEKYFMMAHITKQYLIIFLRKPRRC